MDESTRAAADAERAAARGEPQPERQPPPQGITRPGMPTSTGLTDPTMMPSYKGAPLDAARGPGLGCFWTQIALLAVLLVATPLTVVWQAPAWVSAALLIAALVLLFFVGQTVIFLLRLVAADRRSRRRPLRAGARPTVGQLEDDTGDAARDRSADGGSPR